MATASVVKATAERAWVILVDNAKTGLTMAQLRRKYNQRHGAFLQTNSILFLSNYGFYTFVDGTKIYPSHDTNSGVYYHYDNNLRYLGCEKNQPSMVLADVLA